MKKVLISAAAGLIALSSYAADNYKYLSFQRTDGTTVQVDASGAEITYADGVVTVSSSSDTFSINFAELSKMYFTSEATGVAAVEVANDFIIQVYSTAGVALGSFSSLQEAQSQLGSGVYVIKSGDATAKIAF